MTMPWMAEINRWLRQSPSSRPFLLLKVQHGDDSSGSALNFNFLRMVW